MGVGGGGGDYIQLHDYCPLKMNILLNVDFWPKLDVGCHHKKICPPIKKPVDTFG